VFVWEYTEVAQKRGRKWKKKTTIGSTVKVKVVRKAGRRGRVPGDKKKARRLVNWGAGEPKTKGGGEGAPGIVHESTQVKKAMGKKKKAGARQVTLARGEISKGHLLLPRNFGRCVHLQRKKKRQLKKQKEGDGVHDGEVRRIKTQVMWTNFKRPQGWVEGFRCKRGGGKKTTPKKNNRFNPHQSFVKGKSPESKKNCPRGVGDNGPKKKTVTFATYDSIGRNVELKGNTEGGGGGGILVHTKSGG